MLYLYSPYMLTWHEQALKFTYHVKSKHCYYFVRGVGVNKSIGSQTLHASQLFPFLHE